MSSGRGPLFDFWGGLVANPGTKVVSVVIALVLWGVVLGSRNVEVTKEIPIEVITPPDIVPANDIPEKIAFRLAGPKAFLRSILDRRDDSIRVNLSGAKPGLVTYRFFSDNIRVPIGVKVLSINPTAIFIKLENVKKKEVSVRMELSGTPPEGYRVVSTAIRPETILVRGAASRVDSMSEIPTSPIDVSNLKKSFVKEVPIDLGRFNVQMEGPLPKAFVEIEQVASNFRIKNVDIRLNSTYKVRAEEKSVTVFVRATAQDIKDLDRSEIFGTVDLGGRAKGQYAERVKISLPANMTLIRVVPEFVNVTVY